MKHSEYESAYHDLSTQVRTTGFAIGLYPNILRLTPVYINANVLQ